MKPACTLLHDKKQTEGDSIGFDEMDTMNGKILFCMLCYTYNDQRK